ncbi:hypothetical protein SODG_003278 [Sodalis praecaptivus]
MMLISSGLGARMIKHSLSKTERIIHEMGQQIISGKYIPGSGLPLKRNYVRNSVRRAISFARSCVR